MFKIAPTYRIPFFIALILHAVLFLFLWVHVPTHQYRFSGPLAESPPVEAVVVDSKRIADQVAKIKQRQTRKKAVERAHMRRLQEKAVAARKRRLQEQHRLAQLKAQRLRVEREKQQLEREKHHAEQEKLEVEQQKKAVASRLQALQNKRKKILKSQAKQLQHRLMQQQLQAEQKELAKVKSAQLRGVIDRYKAAILREIGQKWIVPGGANENLSCVYSVQLAPGGVVVGVKLLRSSGNSALDRSAQVAIYKASPVSVPKDPALFDNFRQLRLTVSPKTVVKRSE